MANRRIRSDQEWFEIINECRKSGLTDRSWCYKNNITPSSFYTALSRLKSKAYVIPDSEPFNNNYDFTSKQEVVKVQISQESSPVEIKDAAFPISGQSASSHIDNSHTIEIQIGNAIVRLSNNVNPSLAKMITESLFGGCHYAG